MRLKRIDHIGVVVDDLAEARSWLEGRLGLPVDRGVERADLKSFFFRCGDVCVEAIEILDPAVRRARLGDGQKARVEHIAFEVDDLTATLAALEGLGVRMTAAPRVAGDFLTSFTVADTSDGVMFQFVQRVKPERSAAVKTTDLCDQYSAELQVCAPLLRHYGKVRAFAGPIATVKVFEDNVLVKEALQSVAPGSVVVVDGGGSLRCALVGDIMAGIAVDRQLAGIIVHGAIRDAAEIGTMAIGVMALATNPLKSAKKGAGERDVPVAFGGVTFTPGQWVYADEDGILVAPRALTL